MIACLVYLFGYEQIRLKMKQQQHNRMQSALVQMKERNEEEAEFSTNQVLREEKNNRTLYYLPCYVRFKVKEVSEIDIQGLRGTISGTLLFSFYYGNLDRHIVDQFVGEGSKAILIQFSRQESLQLKQDKGIVYKEDQKTRMIDFVIRQDYVCNLQGDVFYTPFQIINLYLTITIQSVVLDPKLNDGKRIDIKFNCMTSKEVILLSHSENCKLGNYQLARHFMDSKYKNSEKNPFKPITVLKSEEEEAPKFAPVHSEVKLNESMDMLKQKSSIELDLTHDSKKKKEDHKIKHFQYVHFRIPMYKYPGNNLISIFFPLYVLGFINLLIFFQDISLAGRIGAIATLTLAFIAFIPTINDQIPQTPNIKLVEILVYMETIASILCLIQSLNLTVNKTDSTTYEFVWRQDGFFMSAFIINLLNVAVVITLFIIHKCFWEKVYLKNRNDQGKMQVLKKQFWSNPQCDKVFAQEIRCGRISVL